MPTKHKRHAITETPRVKQALDPLRAELNDERLDLAELVVIGAQEKLARVEADDRARRARRRELTDMIRRGELNLDPALHEEVRRSWLPE